MSMFKIVNTCNFDTDYPDEEFVNLPRMNEENAKRVAAAINAAFSSISQNYPRFWKVVPADYVLKPGFEP